MFLKKENIPQPTRRTIKEAAIPSSSTYIDVSNSNLDSIKLIRQFNRLSTVVATNTLITNLEGVLFHSKLNTISLSGSPFATNEYYRIMLLISIGTNIKLIDGRPVTKEEIDDANKLILDIQPLLFSGWILTSLQPISLINGEEKKIIKDEDLQRYNPSAIIKMKAMQTVSMIQSLTKQLNKASSDLKDSSSKNPTKVIIESPKPILQKSSKPESQNNAKIVTITTSPFQKAFDAHTKDSLDYFEQQEKIVCISPSKKIKSSMKPFQSHDGKNKSKVESTTPKCVKLEITRNLTHDNTPTQTEISSHDNTPTRTEISSQQVDSPIKRVYKDIMEPSLIEKNNKQNVSIPLIFEMANEFLSSAGNSPQKIGKNTYNNLQNSSPRTPTPVKSKIPVKIDSPSTLVGREEYTPSSRNISNWEKNKFGFSKPIDNNSVCLSNENDNSQDQTALIHNEIEENKLSQQNLNQSNGSLCNDSSEKTEPEVSLANDAIEADLIATENGLQHISIDGEIFIIEEEEEDIDDVIKEATEEIMKSSSKNISFSINRKSDIDDELEEVHPSEIEIDIEGNISKADVDILHQSQYVQDEFLQQRNEEAQNNQQNKEIQDDNKSALIQRNENEIALNESKEELVSNEENKQFIVKENNENECNPKEEKPIVCILENKDEPAKEIPIEHTIIDENIIEQPNDDGITNNQSALKEEVKFDDSNDIEQLNEVQDNGNAKVELLHDEEEFIDDILIEQIKDEEELATGKAVIEQQKEEEQKLESEEMIAVQQDNMKVANEVEIEEHNYDLINEQQNQEPHIETVKLETEVKEMPIVTEKSSDDESVFDELMIEQIKDEEKNLSGKAFLEQQKEEEKIVTKNAIIEQVNEEEVISTELMIIEQLKDDEEEIITNEISIEQSNESYVEFEQKSDMIEEEVTIQQSKEEIANDQKTEEIIIEDVIIGQHDEEENSIEKKEEENVAEEGMIEDQKSVETIEQEIETEKIDKQEAGEVIVGESFIKQLEEEEQKEVKILADDSAIIQLNEENIVDEVIEHPKEEIFNDDQILYHPNEEDTVYEKIERELATEEVAIDNPKDFDNVIEEVGNEQIKEKEFVIETVDEQQKDETEIELTNENQKDALTPIETVELQAQEENKEEIKEDKSSENIDFEEPKDHINGELVELLGEKEIDEILDNQIDVENAIINMTEEEIINNEEIVEQQEVELLLNNEQQKEDTNEEFVQKEQENENSTKPKEDIIQEESENVKEEAQEIEQQKDDEQIITINQVDGQLDENEIALDQPVIDDLIMVSQKDDESNIKVEKSFEQERKEEEPISFEALEMQILGDQNDNYQPEFSNELINMELINNNQTQKIESDSPDVINFINEDFLNLFPKNEQNLLDDDLDGSLCNSQIIDEHIDSDQLIKLLNEELLHDETGDDEVENKEKHSEGNKDEYVDDEIIFDEFIDNIISGQNQNELQLTERNNEDQNDSTFEIEQLIEKINNEQYFEEMDN